MLTALWVSLKTRPDELEDKIFLFETKFRIHSDRQQSKSISHVTLNIFKETIVFREFVWIFNLNVFEIKSF